MRIRTMILLSIVSLVIGACIASPSGDPPDIDHGSTAVTLKGGNVYISSPGARSEVAPANVSLFTSTGENIDLSTASPSNADNGSAPSAPQAWHCQACICDENGICVCTGCSEDRG